MNNLIRFQLIMALLLFNACSNNSSLKQFNSIANRNEHSQVFSLQYLNKDTFKTLAVASIDNIHVYRIVANKEYKYSDELGFSVKPYNNNLYMDSSSDGGKTWSAKKLIPKKLDSNIIMSDELRGFYVSKNGSKYFLFTSELYISNSLYDFKKIQIPGNITRWTGVSFNATNDILSFAYDSNISFTDSNYSKLYIVHDTTTKEFSLFSTHDLFSSRMDRFFFNDTCFYSEEKDHALVLKKINYKNGSESAITLPPTLLGFNVTPFIDSSKYTLVVTPKISFSTTTTNDSNKQNSEFYIFYSNDYGHKWDSLKNPVEEFYLLSHYDKQNVLLGIDGNTPTNEMLHRYFCFNLKTNSWFSFSDSLFQSDSTNFFHILQTGQEPYLIAEDENKIWTYLYHASLIPANKLSTLQGYLIKEYLNKIEIEVSVEKGSYVERRLNFSLHGSSNYYYNQTKQHIYLTNKFSPNKDSTVWKTSFDPDKLGLKEGDKYNLQLFFSDNTKEDKIELTKKFTPISFYKQYQATINTIIVIVVYLIIILLILLVSPLTLYRLNKHFPISELIASAPTLLKAPLTILNLIFPVSYLSKTPRVLNAWSKKYYEILKEKFQESSAVINRKENNYIPIPFKTYNSYTNDYINIPQPDSSIIKNWIYYDRTIIQIIGEGGIGKTTLGIQICRWLSSVTKNDVKQIPFIIDFETLDILGCIIDKLKAWSPYENFDRDFIEALLKNKNVILLIDALSEQSSKMQSYIDNIHSKINCNAIVITSRKKFDFQNLDKIEIYPLALTTDKLLFFITTYIENKSDTDNKRIILSAEQQLRLATKIIAIFKTVQVTPLLVQLLIDNFFEDYLLSSSFESALNQIPPDIASIYYKYLETTNPNNTQTNNYLINEDMFRVAELLGYLSIEQNFIPQDFEKEKARNIVNEKYPVLKSIDVIQRLIDNTIVNEKKILGTFYLRFNLDPLAEYLGAEYCYKMHRTKGSLNELKEQVNILNEDAQGFKYAFEQICNLKNN